MALTRDQILSANDLELAQIKVPAWGGTVFVRAMSASERLDFETTAEKLGDKDGGSLRIMALYLCRVICDGNGDRLFKDEDAALILGKKASVVLELFGKASEHNSLTESDIEDLEKNL